MSTIRRLIDKEFSGGASGGVTESCFWDEEEAAKAGIHNIVENGDQLIQTWRKIRDRGRALENQKYRYLHDEKFLHAVRMRAKRLNHMLRPYWEWLCQYLDFRCQMCQEPKAFFDLEVDHIHPLSKGGTNTWDNIQPLCESCNLKKLDKIMESSPEIREAQNLAVSLGLVKQGKKP